MTEKITTPVIIILAIILTGTSVYSSRLLGKVKNIEISKSDEDLGITPLPFEANDPASEKDISKTVNIALFGIDKRSPSDIGRSDSIMIASLDTQHKKIKLTSIMRDTYVNIREFASVDFEGLEFIIDALGGVEITLKENEVSYVPGSSPGTQILNGEQALAYSRIRKIGNGDFERTERQRIILEYVINQGLSAGISQYPKLLSAILPYVDTILSQAEILRLGGTIFSTGIKDIEQFRIPVDGYARDSIMDGVYYLVPDTLEDNVGALHEFIYER